MSRQATYSSLICFMLGADRRHVGLVGTVGERGECKQMQLSCVVLELSLQTTNVLKVAMPAGFSIGSVLDVF